MVRTYKRKKLDQGNYTRDDLHLAVRLISEGRMTIYRAVRLYNIPYSTIYCQVKGTRGKISKTKGRTTAIPREDEEKLVKGLAALEKWGFALTRKELLELVGNYVKKNKLQTPFKNGVPGPDWFISFKRRNNLSIKVPQNVEYSRKKATDPFIIYEYFDKLKSVLDDLKLHDKPDQVWNLDETSMSIDPSKTKVVGIKGKVCTRTVSSPGRENTTVLMSASASGVKAPPLIVFKGINVWDQWVAPEGTGFPGTVYAASKKGWMETDIFRNYFFKTLLPFLGDKRPQLIIYDGHATHIDIEVISKAIEENITILKLPPHSSHLLQPLDLSVFRALKVRWDAKLIAWQRQHIGQKLPKKLFSQFLGETWKLIEADVIQNGFRKGGIIPFNRNAIPQDSFDPSALKRWEDEQKRLSQQASQQGPHAIEPSATTSYSTEVAVERIEAPSDPTPPENVPGTSYSFEDMLLSAIRQKQLPQKVSRRKIVSGAEVITSTEVFAELQNRKQNSKEKKKIAKEKKAKQDHELSSDSGEVSYQESDNEEEFWNQIEEEEKENMNPDIYDTIVDVGKWVIVKYCSKKTIKHYVGQVTEETENAEWIIKFTRKKNNIFFFPPVDDTDTVSEEDIVRILPDPDTDRRGTGLVFNLNFDGFYIS